MTVLPGWIDAHVHMTWSFGKDGKNAGMNRTTQEAAYQAASNAWMTLMAGFTKSVGSPADVPLRGFGMFYDRVGLGNTLAAQRLNGIVQQQYVVTNPDFFPNIPSPTTLAGFQSSQVIQEISSQLRAPCFSRCRLRNSWWDRGGGGSSHESPGRRVAIRTSNSLVGRCLPNSYVSLTEGLCRPARIGTHNDDTENRGSDE
jgi:hypothetical protein